MKEHLIQWLIPLGILFYFLSSWVSDALEDLSGGRVRKLEETDHDLAERLDAWLEEHDLLRSFLRFLQYLSTVITGCAVFWTIYELEQTRNWNFPAAPYLVLAWVVILVSVLADLASRSLLPRCDLFILKSTIPVLLFFARMLLSPMKPVYSAIEHSLAKWKEGNPSGDQGSLEYEILDLMEDEPDGQLEEGEKRMIKGIFELSDTSVKEIMTPRVDMVAIPLSSTVEDARKVFVATGHSRIPVYGRSIDEIKGIVYAKDFLDIPPEKKSIAGMMHNPIFIPETKAVDELLDEIKRTRNHFAVIIDEYGGTSGVVTFEDIIEEIVGDVRDEYDSAEDATEKPQLLPDGAVLLEARTPVSDVNEILGIEIPDSEHADTIGGYICTELGRIPEEGEVFTAPGLFSAMVMKADKRKIQKLKMMVVEDELES